MKYLTLLFAALLTTLVMSSSQVSAVTPPDSCFAFNAGTGTITDYYNYEGNNSANPACTRDVDIPSTIGGVTVTSIGNSAFYSSNQLISVTIPSSVVTIGDLAFFNNQLTGVTIPDSVISIGINAFASNGLTAISIFPGVTSIGQNAFARNNLAVVTIPSTVTSIGNYAFRNNQITSVTIPSSVTFIGIEAFSANAIREVTIPNSVTNINEWTFALQTPEGQAYDRFDFGSDPASVALSNQTVSEFFYTKLYTEDPSNPNNLQSEILFYETELDGLDEDWDEPTIVGGHIVNPASAELRYVNQANTNLQTSRTFTGQLPNNTYLSNYNVSQGPTIPMPLDAWNPTVLEAQAARDALSAYYRIGDTVTIDPPAIDGYITPPTQTFVLGAADNTFSYVYSQPASATPGTGAGDSDGELANTGAPMALYVAGALGMSMTGAYALLRKRR